FEIWSNHCRPDLVIPMVGRWECSFRYRSNQANTGLDRSLYGASGQSSARPLGRSLVSDRWNSSRSTRGERRKTRDSSRPEFSHKSGSAGIQDRKYLFLDSSLRPLGRMERLESNVTLDTTSSWVCPSAASSAHFANGLLWNLIAPCFAFFRSILLINITSIFTESELGPRIVVEPGSPVKTRPVCGKIGKVKPSGSGTRVEHTLRGNVAMLAAESLSGPQEGLDHLILLPDCVLKMDSVQLKRDLAGLQFNLHLLSDGPEGSVWLCMFI
ncbi:unnamed protein product, partial [Nesidiocoris tenuis]